LRTAIRGMEISVTYSQVRPLIRDKRHVASNNRNRSLQERKGSWENDQIPYLSILAQQKKNLDYHAYFFVWCNNLQSCLYYYRHYHHRRRHYQFFFFLFPGATVLCGSWPLQWFRNNKFSGVWLLASHPTIQHGGTGTFRPALNF
jgi:hypothetical protein